MFDQVIKRFDVLNGMRIPVQLPVDKDGNYDRQCPSMQCRSEHKVHIDYFPIKFGDNMWCPVCGIQATLRDFDTIGQAEYLSDHVMTFVMAALDEALNKDLEAFYADPNREELLSVSMHYGPGFNPVPIPPEAEDVMRQHFTCEECGCRYSALGASFFCPACGHNSAVTTFDASLSGVEKTVALVPQIRGAVTAAADRETAEDSVRHMLENSLTKLVGSLQRLSEALFKKLPTSAGITCRKNAFQNLHESSTLWTTAAGKGYGDFLSASELAELGVFFQQRHLLSHQEGIVDQQYVDRSGDSSYTVGQRLVIKDAAVLRLKELLSKLATGLRTLT